jgi:hypothetical protein
MNKQMKLFLYISSLVLLFLTIFLGYLLYDQKTKTEQYKSSYEKRTEENTGLLDMQSFRQFEVLLNGKKLKLDSEISNGRETSIAFDSVFSSNKLVLYFPEFCYDQCINDAISKLNEKADLIGNDNIVILANTISKIDAMQYKSNHKWQYALYEIKSKQLQSSFVTAPFYFIVDKESGRINSAFVHSKYKPKETLEYLDKIIQNYFSL